LGKKKPIVREERRKNFWETSRLDKRKKKKKEGEKEEKREKKKGKFSGESREIGGAQRKKIFAKML